MILIKNGQLVDSRGSIQADILLKEGKIHAIGIDLASEGCGRVIDAKGKVVTPAFVELHAHFRDPGLTYKEDLETGSHAALHGGYGTVNLMANTKPVVDSPEVYQDIMTRAKELDLVHIFQNYAASKDLAGQERVDFDRIPDSVKFLSDDGFGLFNNKATFELFQALKEKKLGIMIHEEDKELSEIDYRYAEDVHTWRDVYFAGKIGNPVHFCHVSTVDALDAVRYGKAKGYPVTMEVTPHHIYLYDSDFKVHPPIRAKADVGALVEGILDGTVDAIATDHAPHSAEDKAQGSPGMIGLETAFPIAYKVLVQNYGQDLSLVSKLLSHNPAKILGLNKGLLEVGYDGDLTLIDLDQTYTAQDFASKSDNTPFKGESFAGLVEMTIVAGQVRYEREENHDWRKQWPLKCWPGWLVFEKPHYPGFRDSRLRGAPDGPLWLRHSWGPGD